MSTGAGWTAERSACSSIRIWRLAVTWGVTASLMPGSWDETVARGTAVVAPVGALASMMRIGTRSPTRIRAGRVSSAVIVGAAWMAALLMRANARRHLLE